MDEEFLASEKLEEDEDNIDEEIDGLELDEI
jgi:hypothetical protein